MYDTSVCSLSNKICIHEKMEKVHGEFLEKSVPVRDEYPLPLTEWAQSWHTSSNHGSTYFCQK